MMSSLGLILITTLGSTVIGYAVVVSLPNEFLFVYKLVGRG